MQHHFTVDVEEYFHSTALEPWVPRSMWPDLPRRSVPVVRRLLELLDDNGARGTFFILGWLAERESEMVKEIAAAGHEIASHGWNHRVTTGLTPEAFREEARRTKGVLENLTASAVIGYRAPSFSIVPGDEWALDVLLEEGYRYDSSLFPVRVHPSYGYPCDPDPHRMERPSGTLVEVPPATLRVLGANLPAGGGAYFRFFPYGLLKAALKSAESRGASGTFYIHPWELDDGLPRHGIPWRQRLRTRGRSADLWSRVQRLLRDYKFKRVAETVAALLHDGTRPPEPSAPSAQEA
jgi:polysaccharide deacetylase family protein (PEP-CTERM system associated)